MYLVIIAWLYVTLMMAVAEATNTTGSILGAIITFVLYGLLPMALVVYLMSTPARRKALKARQAKEDAEYSLRQLVTPPTSPVDPDTSGEASAAAQSELVTPVRKEP